VTTSGVKNLFFTFDTPVNCNGDFVSIRPVHRGTTDSWYFAHDQSGSGYFYDELPNSHLTCYSLSLGSAATCPQIAGSVGSDLKFIITGTAGSSTQVVAGGGTTTYTFYTATTSPSTSIDQLTTVFLAWSSMVLLLLVSLLVYYYTYGRNRPA